MKAALSDEITAILTSTNLEAALNVQTQAAMRKVLLVAALAFEDDGSAAEGSLQQVLWISDALRPFAQEGIEDGIEGSTMSPQRKALWTTACQAVWRLRGPA